jgi:5-amino-6-(5-phospho-D-ribitylamino)uracil phosphatase
VRAIGPANSRVENAVRANGSPRLSSDVDRRYDLIAIDLDGTLLDSDHRISSENLRAIESARAAGCMVALCTGRGWVECREYARQIGQTEPAVVAGGAIVTCAQTERTLHKFPIDHGLVHDLTTCMLDHGHAVLILKDPDATGARPQTRGHDYIVVSPRGESAIDPVTRWWFDKLKVDVKIVPSLAHDEHPEHTVRVGICGPRAEAGVAATEIRDRFGERVQVHLFAAVAPGARSGDPNAEVLIFEAFDRRVNKWTAIEWMAARHGFDSSRVMAIGNDINDIAMLEGAGLSVAVDNAVPQALAAAKRRTRGNDDHGVAYAIRKMLDGEW